MVLLLSIVVLIILLSAILAVLSTRLAVGPLKGVFYHEVRYHTAAPKGTENYQRVSGNQESYRAARSIADPYQTSQGPLVYGMPCGYAHHCGHHICIQQSY